VRKTTATGEEVEVCEVASAFAGCTDQASCEAMPLVVRTCETLGCDATSGMCGVEALRDGTACTTRAGAAGTCEAGDCLCTPQCGRRECGDDGCGGVCGTCATDQDCQDGRCLPHLQGADPILDQVAGEQAPTVAWTAASVDDFEDDTAGQPPQGWEPGQAALDDPAGNAGVEQGAGAGGQALQVAGQPVTQRPAWFVGAAAPSNGVFRLSFRLKGTGQGQAAGAPAMALPLGLGASHDVGVYLVADDGTYTTLTGAWLEGTVGDYHLVLPGSQVAAAVGCTYVSNTVTCSDGSACTTGDRCVSGTCQGTPVSCDDANPCTDDSCAPALGCVNAPNAFAETCYSGPSVTRGVGACRDGTRTCSQGSFGPCQGEVLPTPEVCNGLDDDCNGQAEPQLTQANGTCTNVVQGRCNGCNAVVGWALPYVPACGDYQIYVTDPATNCICGSGTCMVSTFAGYQYQFCR